jgi:quinol monooxygenase YgiN
MHILHVQIHVKPDCIGAFRAATLDNARESVREPGIVRFDVCQQQQDPARFVLVEVYRSAAAHAAHRETRHYQTWRDAVAPMMAEERRALGYSNVFPADDAW